MYFINRFFTSVKIKKSFLILFLFLFAGFSLFSQNLSSQNLTPSQPPEINGGSAEYQKILDTVLSSPPREMYNVLQKAGEGSELTVIEKGKLFETVMALSFDYKPKDHIESSVVNNIQLLCIRKFANLKWAEATDLVITWLDRLTSHENTLSVKNQMMEAINCLGSLNTNEAALRLNMFLGVINNFVENGLTYDNDIVFAVIRNLGKIGDIIAFENLSSVRNYSYPPEIIREAEISLSRLKVR
ncbi:MAG: hypothetical protein RBT69_06465 [Spirochaetia bacterium]|jgi:hypothetical protein|nr:hypothetical protein [Spirochaetia bacterium]